jgi:hypothetical protein
MQVIDTLIPFLIVQIKEFGATHLAQLDGIIWLAWENGTHLKPYTVVP